MLHPGLGFDSAPASYLGQGFDPFGMAVLLEDIIESIELWLRLVRKPQPHVDPNLDPVLLVPGIAGSILQAVDGSNGREERVWVRIFGADYKFRTKLWSQFDPSTGKLIFSSSFV